MDVLGSILNSMDKPPTMSEKQKQLMKKQKDEFLLKQRQDKERLVHFRESTSRHLSKFLLDPNRTRLKFPPFDQVMRAIVHELAEESGMTAYSFGEEGVDRHIRIFKREFPPSDEELAALRSGEEWTEEKAKEVEKLKREAALAATVAKEGNGENELGKSKSTNSKIGEDFIPNSNYREKYQHLIGLEAAKEAARATKTNKQYGFVPSENKKDHRSIEQTLDDIRRKKRKLLEEGKNGRGETSKERKTQQN